MARTEVIGDGFTHNESPEGASRSRWTILCTVTAIGFFVGGPATAVIVSVFSPLMAELHWSNGLTSSLATGYTLGSLLTTPLVGVALDRYGPRRVMVFGVSVTVASLLIAGAAHTYALMCAAFTLLGIGYSASFYLPTSVVIAQRMGPHRSLGMGIAMGAMSIGVAVFSTLISGWAGITGWRKPIAAVALLAALMLPLILLTIPTDRKPETNRLTSARNWRVWRGDMASYGFIMPTACSVLFSVGMLGIYFHVVPMLASAGFSPSWAGFTFGATWALSGLGSIAIGFIANRVGVRAVLAGSLFAGALGTLCLLGVGIPVVGVACAVIFVVLWGATANSVGQLVPLILSERFGAECLGRLIGVQFAVSGVAGAAAPVITGLLYDESKGYGVAIVLSAFATFLGALIIAVGVPLRSRALP